VTQADDRRRYYNEIAGGSRDRLAAISDGIFAVSMTLLVLGLAVPHAVDFVTESDALSALANLEPNIVTYFMSFLTLGIFWVGQQTQLSQVERTDRDYTWIMLAFLLFVTLVPFSTAFLAAFYHSRVALLEYWVNIAVLGLCLLGGAEYAGRRPPVRRRHPAQHRRDRAHPAELRDRAAASLPPPPLEGRTPGADQ